MQSANINNNNLRRHDHVDKSLTLVERLAEQAARKREAEKKQADQMIEAQVTAVLEQADTSVAAQQIIGSIQNPEERFKALKILEDTMAKEAKRCDHERAEIATAVIAGDLCVNIVRGKQCTRPAESDPRYEDMCKQCHSNKGRLELSKLSDEERYEEKRRRQELKRERDAEAAEKKERLVQQAREKRQRLRARRTSSGYTAAAEQMSVPPLQTEFVAEQQLFQVANDRSQVIQLPSGEHLDLNMDLNMEAPSEGLSRYEQQPRSDAADFRSPILLPTSNIGMSVDQVLAANLQQSRSGATLPYTDPNVFVPSGQPQVLHQPQQQSNAYPNVGVQQQPGSAEPMDLDSSDESLGIDLFGPNADAEFNAYKLAQEMGEENDDEYEPEEDEEDEEELDRQEFCAACDEAADETNSVACPKCETTIHHYAECINAHEPVCKKK